MRNVNCNIMSAPDTADAIGAQIDTNQMVSCSVQAVFGDVTAMGSFRIQASNDICNDRYQAQAFTAVNWTDIPNMRTNVCNGNAVILTIPNMAYRWIRVIYIWTSGGSSTISVNMNGLSV